MIIDYTATFKNNDGSILEVQTPVHYGDVLVYGGATPIAQNQEEHYIDYKALRKDTLENRIMEYVRNLIQFRKDNSVLKL